MKMHKVTKESTIILNNEKCILEVGDVIGVVKKEAQDEKRFRIAVDWSMYGIMDIEADTLEEAYEIAEDTTLPDGEYQDGSFEINEQMSKVMAEEDYPDEY